jgi:hypothetical protein
MGGSSGGHAEAGSVPRPRDAHTPVPPRGKVKPTVGLREMAKGRVYHHLYFQQIGKPDRELASDPRKTLRSIFYSVSGSAVGAERWRLFVEPGEPILNAFTDPKEFPSWLSARAIDYYVDEYTRTGFTGALNYYRCRDRNWEITRFWTARWFASRACSSAALPTLPSNRSKSAASTTSSTPICPDCRRRCCYRRGP